MLSRNKVAVPEGAAGTPPFWSPSASEETRRRGRTEASWPGRLSGLPETPTTMEARELFALPVFCNTIPRRGPVADTDTPRRSAVL